MARACASRSPGARKKRSGYAGSDGGGWLFEVAPGDARRAHRPDAGHAGAHLSVPSSGACSSSTALRFAGGHVYRAQLTAAIRARRWCFVYLHADPATVKLPAKKGTERVRFEGDEAAPAEDDGSGIARIEKGSL